MEVFIERNDKKKKIQKKLIQKFEKNTIYK